MGGGAGGGLPGGGGGGGYAGGHGGQGRFGGGTAGTSFVADPVMHSAITGNPATASVPATDGFVTIVKL